MQKEIEEITIEEDMDENDTTYFENREKELRQKESEIVKRLA